jgi:large subunit ribosomal protein L19
MDAVKVVEEGYKREIPHFSIGDTVSVSMRIKEGEKERVQIFTGIVIGRRGTGTRETFMVRKISYGIGAEKIFPLHSPLIENIKVIKEGAVRRAKLY